MTLEEAQSLGPGDSISLTGSTYIRQIDKCYVNGENLKWDQQKDNGVVDKGHSWPYEDIIIVGKAHNIIINNEYSIF